MNTADRMTADRLEIARVQEEARRLAKEELNRADRAYARVANAAALVAFVLSVPVVLALAWCGLEMLPDPMARRLSMAMMSDGVWLASGLVMTAGWCVAFAALAVLLVWLGFRSPLIPARCRLTKRTSA
jgi:uncharacterized RDD family membrane protein YckC